MAVPAIIGGGIWAWRAYSVYRAGRAAQAAATATQAAVTAERARRAAELARAAAAAQALARTQAREEACEDCEDRCAHLAAGRPGAPYRGGAHAMMQHPGIHSHHMPARSISPLDPNIGPAIQMDPADHRRTFSYGRSPRTTPQLAAQQAQIASGNFMAVQAQDAAEVAARFPGKYDDAIAQMEAYTECLRQNGVIR